MYQQAHNSALKKTLSPAQQREMLRAMTTSRERQNAA